MPWNPTEPGTIAQDAAGEYHVKINNQWVPAPKGSVAQDQQGAYHFNADSLTPPPPAPKEKPAAPTGAQNAAPPSTAGGAQHPELAPPGPGPGTTMGIGDTLASVVRGAARSFFN